jgi:two-component system, LuxR family, response regulator FixJ
MSGDTVAVVDDDDAVRNSLEALLDAAGYATESYSSGAAFLDACMDLGKACVLLDAVMPTMDGLEVLQTLQRYRPYPSVIMMTGNGEMETAARAMRLGAIAFLQKPFVEDELFESVRHGLSIASDAGYRAEIVKTAHQKLERMTQRERQILDLLVTGKTNVEIAGELNCDLRAAEIYRTRVLEKMDADNPTQLMRTVFLADSPIAE